MLMILVRIYLHRDTLIPSIIPHPHLAAHYDYWNFLGVSERSRRRVDARIATRLVHEWGGGFK